MESHTQLNWIPLPNAIQENEVKLEAELESRRAHPARARTPGSPEGVRERHRGRSLTLSPQGSQPMKLIWRQRLYLPRALLGLEAESKSSISVAIIGCRSSSIADLLAMSSG
jgi:hypothetical protein